MHFQIITIFPQFFDSPLSWGLLDKAIDQDKVAVDIIDLRDFTKDKHRTTDDTPYGGGPGMVMKPAPLAAAIDLAKEKQPTAKVFALSPGGIPLTDQVARELSQESGIVLLCGRYEGMDQRISDHYCDGELSIGDYVLTGGEAAALVVIDAVSRQLPGVVGDDESVRRDSFKKALTFPQYTRPREFDGRKVPAALLSGDHEKIRRWRQDAALARTRKSRPDLLIEKTAERLWPVFLSGSDFSPADLQAIYSLAISFGLPGAVLIAKNVDARKRLRNYADQFSGVDFAVKSSLKKAVATLEKAGARPVVMVDVVGTGIPTQTALADLGGFLSSRSDSVAMVFADVPRPDLQGKFSFRLENASKAPLPAALRLGMILHGLFGK